MSEIESCTVSRSSASSDQMRSLPAI